jgi:hypothetical protein
MERGLTAFVERTRLRIRYELVAREQPGEVAHAGVVGRGGVASRKDGLTYARLLERRVEQFAGRGLQSLQVQVEALHRAAAHLHRGEMAVVGQRQDAQVVGRGRSAVEEGGVHWMTIPALALHS